MSPAKTAEPIEMLDSGGRKKPYIRWGAYWRHLANTIEPSTCGGDAACCQITLATYYCGVEQRAPPMFGRAAITMGIGPHSSYYYYPHSPKGSVVEPVDEENRGNQLTHSSTFRLLH